MKTLLFAAVAAVTSGLFAAPAGAQGPPPPPTYNYYDIGAYYVPVAINNTLTNGVKTTYVVGTYEPPSGPTYPFYMTLGALGWTAPILITSLGNGYGTGVNDSGIMCGYTNYHGLPNVGFTFDIPANTVWPWTGVTWLTYNYLPYSSPGLLKFAYGINNRDTVVGWDDQQNIAFSLSLPLNLPETDSPFAAWNNNIGGGVPPTASEAFAINSGGTIAGFFYGYSGFLPAGSSTWNAIPSSTGGYLSGEATAINSSSQIAGYAWNGSGVQTAYLTGPGGVSGTFLFSSPATSVAWGVNDAGWVVGDYWVSTGPDGYVCVPGQAPLDLNTSGILYPPLNPAVTTFADALAINNDPALSGHAGTGYIVGYSLVWTTGGGGGGGGQGGLGGNGNGNPATQVIHGVILTPRS